LAKTHTEIIFGIDYNLNQLFASIDEEFRTKIFPIAVKQEPKRHQKG